MSGGRAQCCVGGFSMNPARRSTIADDGVLCRTSATLGSTPRLPYASEVNYRACRSEIKATQRPGMETTTQLATRG